MDLFHVPKPSNNGNLILRWYLDDPNWLPFHSYRKFPIFPQLIIDMVVFSQLKWMKWCVSNSKVKKCLHKSWVMYKEELRYSWNRETERRVRPLKDILNSNSSRVRIMDKRNICCPSLLASRKETIPKRSMWVTQRGKAYCLCRVLVGEAIPSKWIIIHNNNNLE